MEDNGEDEGEEFADFEDDFEVDEAELEAMKETPIDQLNAFEYFAQNLLSLQQQQNKYDVLFGGIDSNKKEMIQELIKITQQTR